jgi:PPP family 3-phenylpropionic acid transporter
MMGPLFLMGSEFGGKNSNLASIFQVNGNEPIFRSLTRRIGGVLPGISESLKLPVFYFLMNASFAGWQSFFNVHLDQIGFTGVQIGSLNAIFISTSALVVPFWGMMADKFGNNRVLLLLSSVCAVTVLLIGNTLVFHWMVVFIAVISVFHQPSGAVVDGMTMGYIRTHPQFTYGQFRLWGSAGYATASLAVGWIAGQNTHVIFKISAMLFLLLSLFNLFTLPAHPVTGRNLVNFSSFSRYFRDHTLLLFLVIIMFYGIAVSPLHQFINLYYRDIGAKNEFIGLVFFIQAAFEVPTFLFGARLARRLKPEWMILSAMGTSAFRMGLYGLIHRPEWALMLSVLHGITIAFFLIGVVEYVQSRTPDHLRTTGQAMIWAFHYGAGITFGNLILGYLRDATGMLRAMQLHALMALLMVIIATLFFHYGPSRIPRDPR